MSAVSDSELFRIRCQLYAVCLPVILEIRSIAPCCARHVVGSLCDLPFVLRRTHETVVAVQGCSCEILAGLGLLCSVVFDLCAFRQVHDEHLLRLTVVYEVLASRPLELSSVEFDFLYLPNAWSHILRLLVICAVIFEFCFCGIYSGFSCRIVFIICSDAFRQSLELYAVLIAVISERSRIYPAYLGHIV